MRLSLAQLATLALLLVPAVAVGQPRQRDRSYDDEIELDPAREARSGDDEAGWEEEDPYADEEPSLRSDDDDVEPVAEEAERQEGPDTLQQSDPSRTQWTSPGQVVTLHGYLRTRGELQDRFHLGRATHDAGNLASYPFRYFAPIDRDASVTGGCSSGGASETDCYRRSSRLKYASMRFRLQPTIAVSDDVRVHFMVDVFDNMVLGSTPDASAYDAPAVTGYYAGRLLDPFASTLNPAQAGRNSLSDSIYVRRAWAEVGNRTIGQLRFGRMGNHWGLGMMWNAGAGIDADFSSDVDRVMGVTQIEGFTLGAAWDFANEGAVVFPTAVNGIPFDGSNRDDLRQFSFFAAHRLDPEEQTERLRAGRWVLNGGLYFQYRSQGLSFIPANATVDSVGTTNVAPGSTGTFVRRGATLYTIDGWAQFLFRDLRVELETVLTTGRLRNTEYGPTVSAERSRVLQFGYALEAEYRLLDGKLGIYFQNGLATGDRDVVGLSNREDLVRQQGAGSGSDRVTHFSFHPNYRIDLILFRNILGSVGGVQYFRPGLSYDIVRSDYGRLLGVRADAIYSRANYATQTYGGQANLGLELDGSVYYRSEEGPEFLDGFYAMFQYGLLIPLDGLGYYASEIPSGERWPVRKAQTVRLVLGVQF